MKYCTECLHHVHRSEQVIDPDHCTSWYQMVHRCRHPEACTSPIDGSTSFGLLCEIMRREGQLCGPQGKLWEE